MSCQSSRCLTSRFDADFVVLECAKRRYRKMRQGGPSRAQRHQEEDESWSGLWRMRCARYEDLSIRNEKGRTRALFGVRLCSLPPYHLSLCSPSRPRRSPLATRFFATRIETHADLSIYQTLLSFRHVTNRSLFGHQDQETHDLQRNHGRRRSWSKFSRLRNLQARHWIDSLESLQRIHHAPSASR